MIYIDQRMTGLVWVWGEKRGTITSLELSSLIKIVLQQVEKTIFMRDLVGIKSKLKLRIYFISKYKTKKNATHPKANGV